MIREYLGDAVYIEPWEGGVVLDTEYCDSVSTIHLEAEVVQKLIDYLMKMAVERLGKED